MRTQEQVKYLFDKNEENINILKKLFNFKECKDFYKVIQNMYDIENFLIMCNEYENDGIFIDFNKFKDKIEKIKYMHKENGKIGENIDDEDKREFYKGFCEGLEMIKQIFFLEK